MSPTETYHSQHDLHDKNSGVYIKLPVPDFKWSLRTSFKNFHSDQKLYSLKVVLTRNILNTAILFDNGKIFNVYQHSTGKM